MDGSKSVLLVEDDPNISDIYRKALKKAGIKVHHAQNGNDALDQFLKHQPELVLLDVMIPEKTGIEVLRILRTEKKYNAKETVIIILSNVSAQVVEQAAKDYNADGYVLKVAILPEELVTLVNGYLKEA